MIASVHHNRIMNIELYFDGVINETQKTKHQKTKHQKSI